MANGNVGEGHGLYKSDATPSRPLLTRETWLSFIPSLCLGSDLQNVPNSPAQDPVSEQHLSPWIGHRECFPSTLALLPWTTVDNPRQVTIYVLAKCAHLLFFHPLAKYPGPRLAAVTQLWQIWLSFTGRQCFIMTDLHRKYGVLASYPSATATD